MKFNLTGESILGTDVADYTKLADMSTAERCRWPYAIGVRLPGEATTTVTRYSDKAAADLMAHLCDTDGAVVTRWVALTEPEYTRTAVVPGWRQVMKFYL